MSAIYRKGLSELHSGTGPGGEPPKVSIVFIHGLGGHPQRTWSAASTSVGSESSDRRASDTSDAAGPSRKASILSWAKHFKTYKTSLPERSLSTTQSTYSVDRPALAVSPPEIDVDPLTAEPETISPPAASPRGIASNPLSRSTSNITINRATSPGKSSKVYWPRDLLPEDFPDARIFTYGYDTDVVKRPFGKDSDSLTNPSEADTEADDPTDPKIKLNFTELAHQFLVALNRGLPDDVPVIICAHSLGGVLTKRALWESRTHIKDRTKHKLAKLTKAVFFFGTPHKGSSVAAWGKIGANIAQSLRFDATTKHVTRLKLDSEVLDIYHGDFMKLLDEGRFWVHSFQESQALTPVLGKVVEDYSSRIDGTPLQQFEKLPGNHRTMIQFSSSRSEGYRRVKECLKDYIGRFDAKNDAERRSIASAHSAMSLNSNTYYCMPYKRNDRFTGRDDVIDAVSAHFDPPQSATFVALYGLGGIGKTQVAIEVAERWRYRYPSYSIFWVHATNEDAFNQGLLNIAKTLGIPESADTDIRNLIQKWLENRDNGRWLLIIDNVDDRELLNANKGKKIFKMLPCIPRTAHGKVLFTTRHKSIAMDLTTQHVRLDPMSELESLDLIRATFGEDWDKSMEKDALELLEELSYIPLAIVHAACFMCSNSTPIARYLRMYRESEESREELLQEDDIHGLDYTDIDDDTPKTVLNTTWMSLDRVADNLSGPVAIELLAVMTFLHRQNIPMYLLQAYKPDISSFKLNKAFGVIMGHSLVTEDQTSETISMHRLVQLSVRRWLTQGNRKGLTEKYREDAFKLMSEQFPEGSFKEWSKCDQLIIHAETVLNDNRNTKDPAARAKLLQNAANYQNGKGQYQAAETKLAEVVNIFSQTHGVENETTLQAQDQLAWTLRCQAKKDAALELAQKTLETKKKVFGEGHAEVLTTAHIIATVIGEQGKHQEAAALHQANLGARKTLLGEKHLDTLRSAANLSLELWELGKFSEAEDLARETLAVRQQILGAEHPDSLEVAGTLGFILEIQGKYEEAKQIKEQMLEHREKLYGDDHPDTADSCHDMGWIHHQMGNYDAASPMYERALDAKTRLLGDTHWKTLTTECNFPVFFCDMGHYDEGEARYKRLIEKFKRIQGPEHPQTLDATGGLAVILRHQAVICAYRNNSEGYNDKLAEAAECARRSIDGRNKVLGPDHPWTLPPVSHWGYILTLQGEYKKGEEVIRDALTKLEEKMGAEASNVSTSLMFLSKNLYFQATMLPSKPFHANPAYDPNDARLVEAEALARRTLAARKKLLGEEHPYYFKTQHHLAKVLFAKGEREAAIKLAKEALFGLRKVLGEGLDVEHPDSARAWVEIIGMEMGWVVGIGEVDVSGDKVAE